MVGGVYHMCVWVVVHVNVLVKHTNHRSQPRARASIYDRCEYIMNKQKLHIDRDDAHINDAAQNTHTNTSRMRLTFIRIVSPHSNNLYCGWKLYIFYVRILGQTYMLVSTRIGIF